jgi:hypothetical protein
MASREQLQLLKRTLYKDERLLRLKEAFNNLPEYRMDFKDLHDEIDTMMTTRPLRSLNRKDNFVDNLVEAMMVDQQYRTRVTEILMSCVKTEKHLSRSVDHLSDYLKTEYHSNIYSLYKTKADRESFVDYVLRKFIVYLDKIDELKQRCALLTGDIDKAGYMFKGLLESVQISARKTVEY